MRLAPGPDQRDGGLAEHLADRAERIREWAAQGADTLAYFNNDGDANAVRNARTLRGMLGT